jgi:hypothetical protein
MAIDLNRIVTTSNSIAGTISKTIGTIGDAVNTLQSGVASKLEAADILAASGGKTTSLITSLWAKTLPPGGMAGLKSKVTNAQFKSKEQPDWRVRLTLPPIESYLTSPFLKPLLRTGGLVFPYTPSIQISHSASYQSLAPLHNNYPFLAYENSKIDNLTISGEFYCEDSNEALYWVAMVHYLRSVTKMFYGGNEDNVGSPPPVVRLYGYGDYVFNNVPVVITSFSLDLPKDVDYISTGLSKENEGSGFVDYSEGVSYAPVKSTVNVVLQPLYSREQVRQFSLAAFVKGEYVFNGQGFI